MAALAVALRISCVYLPVSPRWLLLHGRRTDALRESERLQLSRAEVEKDILSTVNSQKQPQLSLWQGLSVIFYRQYRARTTLALFILGMIQLCGIDGVLYVSGAALAGRTWHSLCR
jgi:Sugar (and other) transporter